MAELDRTRQARDAETGGIPSFVGRDTELAELRALYERAAADRSGKLAVIVGAPGVGKTRLLAELLQGFRAAGVPVFEGACREGAVAYQPLLDVAQQLLGHLGELRADEDLLARAADVVAALRGSRRLRIVPRVRDGVDHRIVFYEQVRQLYCDASRLGRPPVILLHDVHLADPTTRALMAYVCRTADELCGLVVAGTAEPQPWLDDAHAHTIALGGLDADGVRAFLSSPSVLERFLRASGGVPRRLEALLEQAPPDSDAVVGERLAALPAPSARLVRALALYGRPGGAALLERLAAGVPGADLAHLRDLPLLNRTVVGGELRLGFAMASMRAAVSRTIDETERPALHRAIGEALQGGVEAAEDAASCAEHLLRGRAGESAVELALGAGEQLERAFAYERAAALYTLALAATGRPEAAVLLEERLADLHQLAGDYAQALEIVERVAARRPDDPQVRGRLGHLHLLRGDFAAAHAALDGAQALAAAAGDIAAEVQILGDLAECHFLAGDKDAALAAGRAAVSLAGGEPTAVRARLGARNSMGKVHLEQGDYGRAAQLFAQNLDEASASGLLFDVSRALINLGICSLRQGDYPAAEAHYQKGLLAANEHGDVRHRAFCLQNLGVLAQWRRDYAAALRHYQDAVQAFKRLGHKPWLAWVAIDLGDLYLGLGDATRAEAMANLASRLSHDVPTAEVILGNLRGRILLEKRELGAARGCFTQALETARRIGNKDEESLTLLHLARLELTSGDPDASLVHLAQVPTPCSAKFEAARLVARGEARLARGEVGAARADLGAGEKAFADLSDDEGRVRALILAAVAADALGDPRAAHKARALARELDTRLRARVPEEFAASYGRDSVRLLLGGEAITPAAAPAAAAPVAPARDRRFPKIVGGSPEIAHVLDMVDKVAPHDSLVLIRGESGTGKELVAEAIHERSPRRGRPFVKVNCGALVESLLLSELFGHERGAFTGALSRRKGRFEMADGGTLFLDEIGDISPQTQVALLRVLQTHEFERVGGTQPIRVDVRIVCATNRDLESMVHAGRFREDLYYRLKGIEIDLPSLRTRAGDVAHLVRHFLARIAEERGAAPKGITPAALDTMLRYPWPGNIRELENVIRSVTLFTDGDAIDVGDLGEYLGGSRTPHPLPAPAPAPVVVHLRHPTPAPVPAPIPAAGPVTGDDLSDIYGRALASGLSLRELKRRIELECITRALAEAGGNITRAAEKLGMKRPRLSQLLKEHGIRGTEEKV